MISGKIPSAMWSQEKTGIPTIPENLKFDGISVFHWSQ